MTYAIFGLLTVILIVFCILAAKTWHWLNIVLVILCWAAGLTAVYGLSQSMKLRKAAIKNFDDRYKALAKAEVEFREAVYGPADSISYGTDSLRGINEVVAREFAGRGRVWANGSVELGADNSVQFTFKTARTELGPKNQIQGVVLYAFADSIVDGTPYPVSFVAVMEVSEEQLGSITLEPTFVADRKMFQQVEGVTWSLFEKMPADRRNTFRRKAGYSEDHFDDTGDALDQKITEYRKILTEEYLPPGILGMDGDGEEYERFIDRYCFDGLTIGQIESWVEKNSATRKTEFSPEAEEVFIKYEFTGNSEAIVVDAEGDMAVEGTFTPLGRAVDKALHAGKDVKFVEGDVIVIDQLTANGYRRGEVTQDAFDQRYPVREIGKIYRRQLRDYPFMLAEYRTQAQIFEEDTNRAIENIKITNEAIANTDTQIQARVDQIDALRADSENLARDKTVIDRLFGDNQSGIAELESKKQTLEASNENLYQRIKTIAYGLLKNTSGVAGSR